MNINTLPRNVIGHWSNSNWSNYTSEKARSGVKLKCCVTAAKSVWGYYGHTHTHAHRTVRREEGFLCFCVFGQSHKQAPKKIK